VREKDSSKEGKKKEKHLTTSSNKKEMGSEFLSRNRRQNSRAVPQTRYCHNPYSQLQSYSVVNAGPASKETLNREVAKKVLPSGTLRVDLSGKVPFFAFPDTVMDRTRQRSEAPPLNERPSTLRQIFFGQLPYKVSDAMVVWLCDTLAESEVLYIERVMQEKSRKGCMQVFVDESDAEFIITALNKRVLFDRTGVWQAQTEEQLEALEVHCNSELNRFKGFPYRPMVVELATSTYVRRHRLPQSRQSGSATPPPECDHDDATTYNDSFGEPTDYSFSPYPPMYEAQQQLMTDEEYYIPSEGPYRSYMPAYDYDESMGFAYDGHPPHYSAPAPYDCPPYGDYCNAMY
jgi:hypothetical protein